MTVSVPALRKKRKQPAAITQSNGAVHISGAWTLEYGALLERQIQGFSWPDANPLHIDMNAVQSMDTVGAWLLRRALNAQERAGRQLQFDGLQDAHGALLDLIAEHSEDMVAPVPPHTGVFARVGRGTVRRWTELVQFSAFVGEAALRVAQNLLHPGRWRLRALFGNLQAAGFNALPITGLLSFLMGVVIAYQGAEQLSRYGANIFIVDLTGLSLLRELAPLLTAIIAAGRSGSAYTAEIGTMKVTEELDALRTMGINPMDLLVLPKVAALMIALPLLTVYADAVGILGAMVIAQTHLGVSYTDFIDRFSEAISLTNFMIGVGKAPVFAALIGLVGCFRGFLVSRSADSVGRETTISVVQGIFLVIVADAVFSVAFSSIGF